MAAISRFPPLAHLRAEPNQHVLFFRGGKLVAEGRGLARWFLPLSASIAQVPVDDIETTFLVTERTADFQDVNVQLTLRYRCADPARAAARVNFAISLDRGEWLEQPLEKLASFWHQRAARPARAELCGMTVGQALSAGAERVGAAIEAALADDAELTAMGLALVSVHVVRVAPSAEVEKALQVPTREAIQQKADEATFSRRALAVEKERAIKENELNNQIELARKAEQLIAQEGANTLARVGLEGKAERERVIAANERASLLARAEADNEQVRAEGSAKARQRLLEVELAHERQRVEVYGGAAPGVAAGLAMQQLAQKIQTIQHLNLTPDLLGAAFQQMLREQADR